MTILLIEGCLLAAGEPSPRPHSTAICQRHAGRNKPAHAQRRAGVSGKAVKQVETANITGVVLAGGRARRMGGVDKGLLEFRGRPLVAYALDALAQAAGTLLISANRNAADYARFGHPVIADATDTFDGPLAGLLSAMQAAQTDYVLTVPCDCPLLDGALLKRLCARLAEEGAEVCVACDGERTHPLFLLAERRLAGDLAAYLQSGQRKVQTWLASRRLVLADCRDRPECFANANTPEDLAALAAGVFAQCGSGR